MDLMTVPIGQEYIIERIAAGDSVPYELLSTIDLIAVTMQGLKGEDAND